MISTLESDLDMTIAGDLSVTGDVLDHLPDPVFAFDASDRITAWNRAAERLFRIVRDDVLGRSLLLYVPHQELKRFTRAVDAARRDGTWTGELHLHSATGDEIHLEAHWNVIAGSVVGIHLDIGERRQSEDRAGRADRWSAAARVAQSLADELDRDPRMGSRTHADRLHRYLAVDPVNRAGIYRGCGDWVLVVDDRPLERELRRALLDAAGYNVITAVDRFAAARLVEDHWGRLQAVIVSLGPETEVAIRELRRRHPLLGVVVDHPFAPEGLHTVDPEDPKDLLRAIAEAVGETRLAEAGW